MGVFQEFPMLFPSGNSLPELGSFWATPMLLTKIYFTNTSFTGTIFTFSALKSSL